ncbi:sigma-70 family RNA polymerase sigma factor [uncultured Oscillibacter sp.]|uniref:sigma-70 family RNA polymerase sigma factor n=1 Tax=uncultured Oscillibacter sp. TaxID=876091 RepID=UPI0025ECC6EC|nr:sigma-70 family RNA polymerase sigma factor [uncultured Oscillibacter sp.]
MEPREPRGAAVSQEEFARRAEAVRGRLYRTAYLYLGSEADALEAVDEAVYQALRALRSLREAAVLETWLTRILLNECHRELRRRRRFAPGGEEALPDTAGPDAYDGLPLREAVRRLPEELRMVVILRFFAGYTQAETADALELPQGTVATRQRRALALLRLELGEEACS